MTLVAPDLVIGQDFFSVRLPLQRNFSKSPFYVSQVIDNRFNSENIGGVLLGKEKTPVIAQIKGEFTTTIHNLLNSTLTKKENQKPVIVSVQDLHLEEEFDPLSEIGITNVVVEFLFQSKDTILTFGKYLAHEEKRKQDVTKTHGMRLAKGITMCVSDFLSSWKMDQPTIYNEGNNYRKSYFPSKYKHGMYYSFNSLFSNRPRHIAFEMTSLPKSSFSRFKSAGPITKEIKRSYVLSDGTYVYLNSRVYSTGAYFIQSSFIGKYIGFIDKFVPSAELSSAIAILGPLGGGLALVGAEKELLIIDLDSGTLNIANDGYMKKVLSGKSNSDLQVRYLKSDKEPESMIQIFKLLNDRLFKTHIKG